MRDFFLSAIKLGGSCLLLNHGEIVFIQLKHKVYLYSLFITFMVGWGQPARLRLNKIISAEARLGFWLG